VTVIEAEAFRRNVMQIMASGHDVRAGTAACDNQTKLYSPKMSEKE
jgi:hypothetical protein